MSQDNGTPAVAQAALETDSSFADAFDLDSDGAANGEKQVTEDADGFAALDEDETAGSDAGAAEAGSEEGATPDTEEGSDAEGGNADGKEGDGEAEGEEEGDKPADKPKKQSGSARLKAQNAELKAKLEELMAGKPDIKSGDTDAISAEVEKRIGAPPKKEDFENFLDYEHEAAAYAADKRIVSREVKAEVERTAKAREALDVSRREALAEAHSERLDAVEKAVPGALAKIEAAQKSGALPITPMLNEAILDSDKSGLLHLHFAENPTKLAELVGMHPIKALRELGKIEASLSLPKPKTTTKAPPPPKPAPRGSAAPSSPDSQLNSWLSKRYGG